MCNKLFDRFGAHQPYKGRGQTRRFLHEKSTKVQKVGPKPPKTVTNVIDVSDICTHLGTFPGRLSIDRIYRDRCVILKYGVVPK